LTSLQRCRRVTNGGSVTVTDNYMVEFYSHVMHIVSNVVGGGTDRTPSMRCSEPASNRRCTKVTRLRNHCQLEPETGAYAGGVGYFSLMAIWTASSILRTGIVKDGMLHVRSRRRHIVADSDPEYEHRRCEADRGAYCGGAKRYAFQPRNRVLNNNLT
jgi:anthranilate synthase component 1